MHDQIEKIFHWYKAAMASVGRKAKFPKAKDVTKTYPWRQLESFAIKMNDLEFSDDDAKRIIITIVKYAKTERLLNRGFSLLAKQDLFEICYAQIKNELNVERQLIESIRKSALFLERQSHRNKKHSVLLDRKKPQAYANITCWFQAGKLSKAFIAMSKSCCSVLAKLDEDERQQFPTNVEIIKIRHKCASRKPILQDLHIIMSDDIVEGA